MMRDRSATTPQRVASIDLALVGCHRLTVREGTITFPSEGARILRRCGS